jgi:indole-3-glycerol phosphate synthase
MNKLDEIIAQKRTEVARIKPLEEKLRAAALERNDFRSLYAALHQGTEHLSVIAEVKKASPSAGIISENFDPLAVATAYDRAGASAISVLTDETFFHGHLSFLARIREQTGAPLLRKDFIVDEVQIYESAVAGADAILLIVAALPQADLKHLLKVAAACQLDVLVEVHDRPELERALETDACILGINNRNLKTFVVDLHTTEELAEDVPEDMILVSESGIRTVQDARQVYEWGANGILVGEALMRSGDPARAIHDFMACAKDGI